MGRTEDKRYTIAVMTGEIQSDYSEELIRGFCAGAKEENVNLVLLMGPQVPSYCSDIMSTGGNGNDGYQFDSIYQYAHFVKPDAIVITYGSLTVFYPDQTKEQFLQQFQDIPCVMIEDSSGSESVPYLTPDNYGGMVECVEHLIVEHGYRRIAFLSGQKGRYSAEIRKKAYCDTMQKHGIPVEESMIAYGDYTDRVEQQVSQLLDTNPNLEAIVCANDGMAKACYKICVARNMVIGKDIAITGFDNTKSCCTMTPPLTSVSPNTFQISYQALKHAVALCKGEKIISGSYPSRLMKRCSCGCTPVQDLNAHYIATKDMGAYLKKAVRDVSDYVFASVVYQADKDALHEALLEYFLYVYDKVYCGKIDSFRMGYLLDIIRRMVDYAYVPEEMLLDHMTRILQMMLANATDNESQRMIASIISSTQQFLHALSIENLEREIHISNRKSWFVPSFTRDLSDREYMNNSRRLFLQVMQELKKMQVRRAYFFLFDEAVSYKHGCPLDFPEEMSLVAYFDEKDMCFYSRRQQPKLSRLEGFMSYIHTETSVCLTPVILFSGREQYGVMVCDVIEEDIAFMQICSVQLGTLLHFIELNMQQEMVQKKLENSLKVIQENNRMLSFISARDELTQLLNRRGFIEESLALYEKSEGKHAYVVYGDLDHLKQINDRYGHREGDYAICNVADRMTTLLPADAVVGRMGGDEFVAFLISDEEHFEEILRTKISESNQTFNGESNKPYYIEFTVGVYGFTCSGEEDFYGLLNKADELLYQAKKKRRKDVTK